MHVLEARFHPEKRPHPRFLIVGRVFCDGRRAVIAPVAVAGGVDPSLPAMLEKLRYLVRTAGWRPYRRLLALESDYWSFVDVTEGLIEGGM
jgi:hypothetical protein